MYLFIYLFNYLIIYLFIYIYMLFIYLIVYLFIYLFMSLSFFIFLYALNYLFIQFYTCIEMWASNDIYRIPIHQSKRHPGLLRHPGQFCCFSQGTLRSQVDGLDAGIKPLPAQPQAWRSGNMACQNHGQSSQLGEMGDQH